jgi:hypothetical protein
MFTADMSLGTYRWPLVRLGAGSRTEIVLLSQQFFQLTTHWHKCTVLCPGEDCPLCDLLPSRGLFYLAVICASRPSLLELGAQSAASLEQHCKLLHGGMKPGHVLSLFRRTAKSPVHSEVLRFQENASAVTTLTLAQRVLALYKFPPPNPNETLERYEGRIREAAKIRLQRVAQSILKG